MTNIYDSCTDKRSWSIASEIYFHCIEYWEKIVNSGPHKTVNQISGSHKTVN